MEKNTKTSSRIKIGGKLVKNKFFRRRQFLLTDRSS